MEKEEISLSCSCGGTITAKIDKGQESAVAECACGRIVIWRIQRDEPPTLGISVAEYVKPIDKF